MPLRKTSYAHMFPGIYVTCFWRSSVRKFHSVNEASGFSGLLYSLPWGSQNYISLSAIQSWCFLFLYECKEQQHQKSCSISLFQTFMFPIQVHIFLCFMSVRPFTDQSCCLPLVFLRWSSYWARSCQSITAEYSIRIPSAVLRKALLFM